MAKKSTKIWAFIVTGVIIAGAAIGGGIFASRYLKDKAQFNPDSSQSQPANPSEQKPGGEEQTPGGEVNPGGEEQKPGGEITPGGEEQKPGGEVNPGGEQKPDEQDITREEFETKLEEKIVEGYNAGLASYLQIKDVKILAINESEGVSTIYYEAELSNKKKFGTAIVNNNALQCEMYKDILKNLNDVEYPAVKSRITEQGVPEDVCAFALSQSKVKQALSGAGISTSDIINYKVLNTTEFKSSSNGRFTDITMLVGDKIVTLTMGGTTGVCDSQREYLTKLQNGRLSIIDNIEIKDYSELSIDNAKTSSIYLELPSFISKDEAGWYAGTWNIGGSSVDLKVGSQPNLGPEL